MTVKKTSAVGPTCNDKAVLERRMLLGLMATGVAAGLSGLNAAAAQTSPTRGAGSNAADLSPSADTIDLWPAGAPGLPSSPLVETVNERSADPQWTDRAVFGINRPRMAVFRPARPNGAAVIITPGGGYRWVVVDREGFEMARWLSERGYTAFVLFYRLPGEGWAAGPDAVLQDTQRAVRLVRSRAAEFGINPQRIAAMGFSAGGHACADLAARFDQSVYTPVDDADHLSARPNIAAPIYPVISMSAPLAHMGSRAKLIGAGASPNREAAYSPDRNVPDNAPPHFLVHAEDDRVVLPENTLLLRAALRARGIAAETHLFADGGHGFGLKKISGKPAAIWPELFISWAKTHGV